MVVYHVTNINSVAKILKQGIRFRPVSQKANWSNSAGKPLGGGEIYAFEEKVDAWRWAAKWDWDMSQAMGTGKVVVLTLETGEGVKWDPDFTDPLTQSGSEGQWLKAFQEIPAEAVVACEVLTPAQVKEVFKRNNERVSVKV